VFWPALNGPFVFDDLHLPFFDPYAAQMPARFWLGGVRPLLMASYWLNFAFFRTDPWPYHATNIALHCLTATILFFSVRRLTELALGLGSNGLAFAAAAIFLLHPLQTEPVDYVAGRSEVLCGLFVLAGWLIFLERIDRPLKIADVCLILLCAIGAVLSKESGICLLGILLATDLYWGTGTLRDRFERRKAIYIPVIAGALIAVAFILRSLAHSATAGFSASIGPGSYALTQMRVIATYLRLFFYPVGLNLDWGMSFLHTISRSWPWMIPIAGTMVLTIVLYRRVRLASFGLVVFFVTIAPTSSFIPINDALAERRMYLPVAGLAIFVAGMAAALRAPERVKRLAICAVLLACALLSFQRSVVWSDDERLWSQSILQNPGNARAHAEIGGSYIFRKDCARAAIEYAKAATIEGLSPLNGRNLAAAYECSKQNEKALETYKDLVAEHPGAMEWTRIGYLEALKNDVSNSLAAFENALHLDPNYSPAWSYRGTGRLALGNVEGARSDFKRALELDPGDPVAASGLVKISGKN